MNLLRTRFRGAGAALGICSVLISILGLGSFANAQERAGSRSLREKGGSERVDVQAEQRLAEAPGAALGVTPQAPLATTLLDTRTNATTLTFTGSAPRTYMGDCFTNNSLPANTTNFKVTGVTMYLVAATAVTYTDIVARIQFWNNCNAATDPVFTSPAGALQTIDVGPLTTVANTIYTINVTFPTPITLAGGNGTNWGFAQNFQGNTGAGLADNPDLTSLITASTTGYAAGTITTGTSPNFGYYRNASGRTDFNFLSADARSLGGAPAPTNQAVGIIITGNNGPTAAGVTVAGRVLAGDGRGITNAVVTITDGAGATRTTMTGRRGNFQFDDVESGSTYTISVGARRFSFEPQIVQVNDNVGDLTFTAQGGGLRR